jgi:hypothetical protein
LLTFESPCQALKARLENIDLPDTKLVVENAKILHELNLLGQFIAKEKEALLQQENEIALMEKSEYREHKEWLLSIDDDDLMLKRLIITYNSLSENIVLEFAKGHQSHFVTNNPCEKFKKEQEWYEAMKRRALPDVTADEWLASTQEFEQEDNLEILQTETSRESMCERLERNQELLNLTSDEESSGS